MPVSRAEALEYLELPIGADPDSIRTSYKRLAQKWFPDKHGHSSESVEKFRQVSIAYKRLTIDSEYTSITELEMYETYNRVVNQQKPQVYTNGFDSTDDDDDGDSEEDILSQILKTRHNKQRLKQNGLNNNRKTRLTAEEIDRNATELITEEEREKRKAEKRRAKKKRQREKKRLEKQDDKDDTVNKKENGHSNVSSNKDNKKIYDSSGSEAEEFDPTAAFFTQVKSKKKKSGTGSDPPVPTIPTKARTVESVKTNGVPDDKVDDLVLRSRQLAIEGNRSASLGHYNAAIELFTEAIKLDPRDFRFFGNRSYCYDRVQQYDRALKDADKAITLAPEWPKGYFRKGRALAGLKLYADAEQAFMQVLKLDKSCEDAMTELIRVRTHQLTEMGFTIQQAEQAIKQYGTVQTALDSLLAGVVADTHLGNEIYESDDEDYSMLNSNHHTPTIATPLPSNHHPLHTKPLATTPTIPLGSISSTTIPPMQPIIRNTKSTDLKMNSSNPEGLTALWVGNVLPDVSQTKLLSMFQKYGTVTSIRMLPEKYCSFINFKTKEAAGRAMNALQDEECNGQRLLIKFPDNPVANGSVVLRKGEKASPTTAKSTNPGTTTVVKKPQQQTQQQYQDSSSTSSSLQDKNSGPVNGDECYFWRTTGCQFGDDCHYKHVSNHKGVDRKPWQKVK